MGQFKTRLAIELGLISILIFIFILPACRKEAEPLDRNRPPETVLTSSPPCTTEADYRVHMYWHGTDKDGVVQRYIWYRSDTLMTLDPEREPDIELLDWNPEARKEDYLKGRFTTKTDTVFIFTGFDTGTGALLNKQAFHIAAVDDGGLIDPTPARTQFFARVKGIPKVEFWTLTDTLGSWKPYELGKPDTISMFTPFKIKFTGNTINNWINGYRWIYSGEVRPDIDQDGIPDWYVPTQEPPETVTVTLKNSGGEALPSGDFFFKVIARDEAGALSKSDIITGEGACNVVINHDPDTWIFRAECFYKMKNGIDTSVTMEYYDFYDDHPDTFPYNSRLRLHYEGWDDPKDTLSLEFPPPNEIPMRFQFMFDRFGTDETGAMSSYATPWYPTGRAEDTDKGQDVDSTTMRVGTYTYIFAARSFDEQYRADGTPDTVGFFGNFPPTIDDVQIGYDAVPLFPEVYFTEIRTDTLFIGVDSAFIYRPDIASPYNVEVDTLEGIYTYYYRFFIRAFGRDDYRDPPKSGVKGWKYIIAGPEDYYFRKENEWIYEFPLDTMFQELNFKVIVPIDTVTGGPDFTIVNNPPGFLGEQHLEIRAKDIAETEKFYEGIRGKSPVYDDNDSLITPGSWVLVRRNPENYARLDMYKMTFYIKMVR